MNLREYQVINFGYVKDHYCIDDDNGNEVFDCHNEDIAKQLFNYLKKIGSVDLIDIKTFFRFLYENSEHYQFYYDSYIDLMNAYSN